MPRLTGKEQFLGAFDIKEVDALLSAPPCRPKRSFSGRMGKVP